jgi:hypothetical protein
MTHMRRSRRLQAGLAGLSLVSALGAAVGLGLTTHAGTPAQASQGAGGSNSSTSTGATHNRQTSPVTPSTPAAPQATTSGS